MVAFVSHPPTKTLGAQLRFVREQRGLTLRDVATAIDGDLSWQALSKLERDERNPRLQTLEALARTFSITFVTDANGTRVLPF